MYNTLNEFKFSINKNCIENMPDFKTEIPNLYFGSVIVKGDQPMISQEMACTNGKRQKYNISPVKIKNHNGTCSILFYPIRIIDKILFYCIINQLLIFICYFSFFYIYYNYKLSNYQKKYNINY